MGDKNIYLICFIKKYGERLALYCREMTLEEKMKYQKRICRKAWEHEEDNDGKEGKHT